MRMPIKLIPQEFIDLYNLTTKVKNGYVYIEIRKGMYGFPQVGFLPTSFSKKDLRLRTTTTAKSHTPLASTPTRLTQFGLLSWWTISASNIAEKNMPIISCRYYEDTTR